MIIILKHQPKDSLVILIPYIIRHVLYIFKILYFSCFTVIMKVRSYARILRASVLWRYIRLVVAGHSLSLNLASGGNGARQVVEKSTCLAAMPAAFLSMKLRTCFKYC